MRELPSLSHTNLGLLQALLLKEHQSTSNPLRNVASLRWRTKVQQAKMATDIERQSVQV